MNYMNKIQILCPLGTGPLAV